MEWTGEERRAGPILSAEQIEAIAERAAEKALEKVYSEIGRNVVRKAMFVIGAAILALAAWLGWIPKPGG